MTVRRFYPGCFVIIWIVATGSIILYWMCDSVIQISVIFMLFHKMHFIAPKTIYCKFTMKRVKYTKDINWRVSSTFLKKFTTVVDTGGGRGD